MEQVKFTEEETKQLAEAHAIRQRVRAARRQRQADADRWNTAAERRRKEIEADEVKRKLEAKKNFDDRVRTVLIDLTVKMKANNVHLLANPLTPFGSQRYKIFSVVDTQGVVPDADIYWVYGKGFEWA